VSLNRKRIVTAVAALGGAGLALLAMTPLFIRDMSPVTAGMIEGAVGVVCLVGVAFGVWDARRIETKRKTKERIWFKH
jgi:preprotein translocase subunit SecY